MRTTAQLRFRFQVFGEPAGLALRGIRPLDRVTIPWSPQSDPGQVLGREKQCLCPERRQLRGVTEAGKEQTRGWNVRRD